MKNTIISIQDTYQENQMKFNAINHESAFICVPFLWEEKASFIQNKKLLRSIKSTD